MFLVILFTFHFLSPGLILSGQCTSSKSTPPFKPVFSRIGNTISSHTPGLTVDSKITNCPFVRFLAILSVAFIIGFKSGFFLWSTGVGTQITIYLIYFKIEKSVVALILILILFLSIGEFFLFISLIFSLSISKPSTLYFLLLAIAQANGNPT